MEEMTKALGADPVSRTARSFMTPRGNWPSI